MNPRSAAHASVGGGFAIRGVRALAVSIFAFGLPAAGCNDTPYVYVVVDNDYPTSTTVPLVIYQASWQAVSFTCPIPPGTSSGPQSSVSASANTAYAVLAPGWDPTSSTPPTSFVLLQSRAGFAVHFDNTLHIPVDDTTFAGNCAAGSFLTQAQADTITQLVFPCVFAGLHYDAATCTTTPSGDGGACEISTCEGGSP